MDAAAEHRSTGPESQGETPLDWEPRNRSCDPDLDLRAAGSSSVTAKVMGTLEEVTADWLTSALTRSGALEEGAVDHFEVVDRQQRELSTGASLKLSFKTGSRGAMPERLFLKMVNTVFDNDEPLLPSEVDYYARDYRGVRVVPIVPCYDAALSEDSRRYHVLLDDVSQTHVRAFERPFTLGYGLALAEGLAEMHAHWWGGERLRQGGFAIPPRPRSSVSWGSPAAGWSTFSIAARTSGPRRVPNRSLICSTTTPRF